MRHVRTTVFCLLAMLALGAVTAAGASAHLPEIGKCEAQAGGKYEDAGCTVKAAPRKTNGHYEWHTGEQVEQENHCGNCGVAAFEINAEQDGRGAVSPTTFQIKGGQEITCADTRSLYGEEAEVTYQLEHRDTVGELYVRFTNCKEVGGEGKECYSSGFDSEEEGEGGTITDYNQWLEGEPIRGKLETIAGKGGPSPTVGVALSAFEPKGESNERRRLLTAECEGRLGTVWIGGETKGKNGKDEVLSVIGSADVDQTTASLTQTFSESGGVQEPDALEKGQPRFLEAFVKNGWQQLGVASTWEAVSKESHVVEIKAIP